MPRLMPLTLRLLRSGLAAGLALAASTVPLATVDAAVRSEVWGQGEGGRAIHRFTMTNASGAHVSVMELGAAVTELWVPDSQGQLADVVLGYDKPLDYATNNSPQFGLVIGRFANRIVGGRFSLGGTEYRLPTQGRSTSVMHGGAKGFGTRIWSGSRVKGRDGEGVKFTPRQRGRRPGFSGPDGGDRYLHLDQR